jgi:hypothetical protein
MRALGAGPKAGTDVAILQDLPDTARPEVLELIAKTLNKAARDWESPVTVSWADVRDEPDPPVQLPPLVLTSHLIKTLDASSSIQDFPVLLSQFAESMERFSPGAKNGDIAAAISFYRSAGALDAQHIFLIISSFPDLPEGERGLELDLSGIKVVMLPAPNAEDASDEAAYANRVAHWQVWLNQRHANVCRIPLNGLTTTSLAGCIYGH